MKNCPDDEAEKYYFKSIIKQGINLLREEVDPLKLTSGVEKAFETEPSVKDENKALRKEVRLLSVKLSSEE